MKVKADYILRQVAGSNVVLPVGTAAICFDGMMTLNDSGVMLWHLLEQGAQVSDLAGALTAEYDVTEAEAMRDVTDFLSALRSVGCLEE